MRWPRLRATGAIRARRRGMKAFAHKRLGLVALTTTLVGAGLALSACGESAKLPLSAGIGPSPRLPQPEKRLFPTVNIAPAVGWAGPGTSGPMPRFA